MKFVHLVGVHLIMISIEYFMSRTYMCLGKLKSIFYYINDNEENRFRRILMIFLNFKHSEIDMNLYGAIKHAFRKGCKVICHSFTGSQKNILFYYSVWKKLFSKYFNYASLIQIR